VAQHVPVEQQTLVAGSRAERDFGFQAGLDLILAGIQAGLDPKSH
jgi:hypothetical protein